MLINIQTILFFKELFKLHQNTIRYGIDCIKIRVPKLYPVRRWAGFKSKLLRVNEASLPATGLETTMVSRLFHIRL